MVQRAEYEPASPIFELCLAICEEHKEELEDILGDTLFAYARYGEEINIDPQRVYNYCWRYHELCKQRNDGTQARREDLATSHTSLAQGYLLLDDWEPAVEHCRKCAELDSKLPEVVRGDDFPQFAYIFEAWGLYGLERYDNAEKLLVIVIDFRTRRFGENDKLSPK